MWDGRLPEHQIRGWEAVSAPAMQGKGSREGSNFFVWQPLCLISLHGNPFLSNLFATIAPNGPGLGLDPHLSFIHKGVVDNECYSGPDSKLALHGLHCER